MLNGGSGSVVDRLAAAGPSKVRGPHCWFCGKVEPWFTCDCKEARDAQQGKRAKPRFDAKLGAMILDEEIIQRNLAWGFARRYVPAEAKPAKPPRVTPPPVIALPGPVDAVDATPVAMASTEPSTGAEASTSETAVDATEAARASKRERMRRWRAKKDHGDSTDPAA